MGLIQGVVEYGPPLNNGRLLKTDLMNIVGELFVWPKRDPRAKKIVNTILDCIAEAMLKKDHVTIEGFGRFSLVKDRFWTPMGKRYVEYERVKFTPSQVLKKFVNSGVENGT